MTRVLPPEEWPRLAHTEFRHLPYVTPDELQVVVVEDAGKIIACWGLMPMLHLEGLWVDARYRHRPSVTKQLLRSTWAEVLKYGRRWVMTASADTHITRLLTRHMAARAVPGQSFVISTTGDKRCRWLL